jgi:hypothetical protein
MSNLRIALLCFLNATLFVVSCRNSKPPKAAYVRISQLEPNFGRLITVANAPTPNQHGTGDRLGLFKDDAGTVWGIPLMIADNGDLLGCAPTKLREFSVTDTLPGDVEIVGATNEPNGWREGTGKLELMLRDKNGELHSHPIKAGEVKNGPVCWSQSPPEQPLPYYRLVSGNSN